MAIILGSGGIDLINGGAGNDLILAGAGADVVNGGAGTDIILAGTGSDTADGGAGSDLVAGEAGNDMLIYRAAENAGATDIYDGGSGVDTIRLVLTRNEWLNPLLQQDIAAYLQFLAAHTSANGQADGAQFRFTAFDLRVSRVESLQIIVDGIVINPADQAVVAQNDSIATSEDNASAAINLLANDSVPDLVKNVEIIQGPTKGSYKFDVDLSDAANPKALLTYTPDAALQSLAQGETATDTIVYQVTDADGDVQMASVTVTIHGVNDAATLAVAAAATFTENGQPVTLSPVISLADVDSATLVGATVKITSGFIPEAPCLLRFDAAGTNIQGSYDSKTGVLTLTGVDSLANYQAVLASVSLEAPGDNPTNFGANPTRTIEWQVDDGFGLVKAGTTLVAIEAVNDAPVLSGVAAQASYTENAAPALLSPNLSLADVDSSTLVGATVKITGVFIPDSPCVLRFTEIGNIKGSYDAQSRVLTLTGLDSVANYEAALASVTLEAPGDNPTNFGANPTRTIGWQVDDGFGMVEVGTTTVTIEAVNDVPRLSSEGTGNLDEDVPLHDERLEDEASDPDDVQLTFSLAADASNGNVIVNPDGSFTYTPDQDFFGVDSFLFTASDPHGGSATGTFTVTVNPVNDAPVLSDVAAAATFNENAAPVALSPNLSLADVDSQTLVGATVKIADLIPCDTLRFTDLGNITGSYDEQTGVLTFSGADSVANYQTALASVSFEVEYMGDNPTNFGANPTRTIEWQVDDGSGVDNLSKVATTVLTIEAVNDAPVLSDVAAAATFTENAAPVVLSPNLSLADVDSPTLVGATVKITSAFAPSDPCTLRFTETGNIKGSYDAQTRVLTLTGIDTVANYQAVLASVSLEAPGDNPTNFGQNPTRTIEWQVDDGSGFDSLSKVATTVLTIEAVNDAPALAVAAAATYTENAPPVVLSPDLSLADVDSSTLVGATVKITGVFIPESPCGLRFTETGNIKGSYDAQSRVLTLTGLDSVANYEAALASVTFEAPDDNATNFGQDPTRTIEWQVDDGSGVDSLSKVATTLVTIAAVNDPAIIGTDDGETIIGTPQPDIIDGRGGNDRIFGRESDDDIEGGTGSDVIDGEDGDDLVKGGDGDDSLFGGFGNDTIYGGAGFDILAGALAPNPFIGDDDYLDGGEGDDLFVADSGNDTLIGGDGNDTFEGVGLVGIAGGFSDLVDAGPGDDTIKLLKSGSTITLGPGRDSVLLFQSGLTLLVPTVTDFETGVGGDLFDFGGLLFGLEGWDGNSNPIGTFFRFAANGGATDFQWDIDGPGTAYDWQTFVIFSDSAPGDFVDANILTGYPLDGSMPAGMSFPGTPGEDTLTGTQGPDTIEGFESNDRLFGNAGNDNIDGGTEHDLVDGGFGDDVINGNDGFDTLVGGAGNDTIFGGADDDFLYGASNTNPFLDDDDVLDGGSGNDQLEGGTGEDVLIGGPGNDTLTGDSQLFFGPVVDHFVFNSPADGVDTVIDFRSGADVIDISAAGFGGGLTAGGALPADRFISGSDPLPVTNGIGVLLYDTDNGALAWDADGAGGNAPVTIALLINLPVLSASDFAIV